MVDPHEALHEALRQKYELLDVLGEGGMGTVFLARDLKHDRKVAVKTIHPHLTTTEVRERFEREIQITAHLQHPHILPLHDSGIAGETLYYVMPYVEGESLRDRLERDGTLPHSEAVQIGRDVASALDYAHRHEVIHRDIKPENILLTSERAVVADFGISKAVGETAGTTLTQSGALIGTPGYMPLEQLGGEATGQADIYALGAVLYEALTGRRWSLGRAVDQADWDGVDPEIRSALARALEPSPGDRWEDAGAFRTALKAALKDVTSGVGRTRAIPTALVAYLGGSWFLLQVLDLVVGQFLLPDWVFRGAVLTLLLGLPFVVATASLQEGFGWRPRRARGGLWGLFTWRNAVAGGVFAFAILGLGTAGYVLSRTLGVGPGATLVARGELAELDRIVLAELGSAPADSGLARSLTLLLGVDLSRSPTVRIADPTEIARTLRRMEQDPVASLDLNLATEVARREGFKAVLGGELSRLGTSYVVSVRLLAAQSGAQLLAERETAASLEELPVAVEKLSERLRERIGEPLRSIRAGPPLARVTTPSIEALQLYSEAGRAALRDDYDRAIPLLEEALGLDSTFAMAYRKLAAVLFNSHRDPERWAEANRRAFELRERLPARERLRIEGAYFRLRDHGRAIRAYEALLQRYPDEASGTVTLARIHLMEGDYGRSEELARRAIELTDSVYWGSYATTIAAQVAQGRYDEAEATLDRMAEKLPGHPRMHEESIRLASARGNYAAAEAAVGPLLEGEGPTYETRLRGHEHLAGLEYVRGRLRSGDAHMEALAAILEREGVGTEVQRFAFSRALMHLFGVGDTARAASVPREILERFPLEPMEDPWTAVDLVRLHAAAGQAAEARVLLGRLETEFEAPLRDGDQRLDVLLARARGFVALAEGRPEAAATELRRGARATGHLCYGMCVLSWLARAFDEAGQADSAIAVYEEYVNRPMLYRGRLDAFYLAPAYERLAQLYEGRGDEEQAAEYHARFVQLWQDADEELQPRVRASRERLEAILAEPRGR